MTSTYKVAVLATVVVPFLGFVTAVALWWGNGVDALSLSLFLSMYILTGCFGIAIGYHRYFTHRGFETRTYMKFFLGICAGMAAEGSLFKWVGDHRTHHQHSDRPGDPHSPWEYGSTFFCLLKGFVHAHLGWIVKSVMKSALNVSNVPRSLADDRALKFIDRSFVAWVALGIIAPTVLGGVISGTWIGAGLGFLWGGLVRIFFLHHVTWSVNSVCHMFGSRRFRTTDHSRDNLIFAFLGFGEGNHNSHHAFPNSARHGLSWWQPDLSWYVIWIMEKFHLVWNVSVPALSQRNSKRVSV